LKPPALDVGAEAAPEDRCGSFLLPSATEIVCAIGLGDELVGVPTSATGRPSRGKPVVTRSTHDSQSAEREIHAL
jgi:ABC-type hemin transport system substrate-binding protein